LCKDAIARLGEHYAGLSAADRDALDFSALDVWDERMRDAGSGNDPAAFRAALKGWKRAGLRSSKGPEGSVRAFLRRLLRPSEEHTTPRGRPPRVAEYWSDPDNFRVALEALRDESRSVSPFPSSRARNKNTVNKSCTNALEV